MSKIPEALHICTIQSSNGLFDVLTFQIGDNGSIGKENGIIRKACGRLK